MCPSLHRNSTASLGGCERRGGGGGDKFNQQEF